MSCNDPCGDHIQINIDSAGQGPVGPPGPAAQTAVWKYYLQPGDTIASGPDASGTELAYEPTSVQVFLNGVLLSDDDYTTDSGDSIVLNEAAVGVNDVLMIHSQVGPTDFDPTNDHALLQSQIDDNRTDIDGLRVDVDQHSQDIAELQADQTAQVVTTADVVTVGKAPFMDSHGDPANQYEANWEIHDRIVAAEVDIANTQQEMQALDQDVSNLSQTVTDLATDVDGISISVATNTINISKNASDISQLQVDVGNITVPDLGPLDVRVTDLETLTTSHSSDLVGLRTDVDALGQPTDLGPLNDAISDNSVAIAKNTTDIASIKAVDAQQSSQIGDLQISVGNLEAIDHDHSNHALIDQDNVFTVSQTIKDGIKLTGSQAFIECDTGTALQIKNGNFSNSVVDIIRSNGDVAISLEASGHIRGLATDSSDPSSAVNVAYLDGIVGGGGDSHTHDDYATRIELKTEENARILGDQKLADDIADAILTEKYNDAELRNKIAAEETARAAGDSNLSKKIDTEAGYRQQADDDLQAQIDAVDVSVYATIAYVDATIASAGFATEKFVEDAIDAIDFPEGADLTGYATEEFVTNAIDAIEFPSGTVVSDTPPADPEEGATWYDTVRLELFVFAEEAWLPCSPLGARVDAGEVLQAQILSRVEAGEAKQASLESGTLKTSGTNAIETSWRVKSDRNTVMSGSEAGKIKIYNLAEPTEGHHASTKTYSDTKLSRSGNDNDVLGDWRVRQENTEGDYRTLIHGDKGQLGLYNLKDPTDSHHAVPMRYVDQKVSEIQFPQAGGPTDKYNGNRFNVSGLDSKLLVENDVMFLQGAATVTNLGTIDAIALPEDEFDWEGCSQSGVVKVMNGGKLAGYFSVYDMVKNEGRNVILKVQLLKLGDDYNVSYETGTPCYFHGVFFK